MTILEKNNKLYGEESHIVKFYRNRNILITGGTGFVGKVLIEKLLRTCTSVATIFVLIRPKRNKQPQERLQELLACRLFDIVRQQDEGLLNKVIAVEGDVEKVNLGMSDVELAAIERQVSVVYNVAATVRFNEPLKRAVKMNIIGTKNVLELCRRMSNLSALVHVSTAYVNYEQKNVDERIYPDDMRPDKLIKLNELLDDNQMEALKPAVLKNLPNTYVFTKKQAEWLVLSMASELPVVICRPAIVSATWREPFGGWIDNANAGTAVFLNQGLGYLRTMLGKTECLSDLVPVDKVVAMIISLGWYVSLIDNRKNNKHIMNCMKPILENDCEYQSEPPLTITRRSSSITSDVPIFHCTSGQVNPINWSNALFLSLKYWLKYPSISANQYPTKPFTRSKLMNKFYRTSLQTLPAYLEDLLAIMSHKETNRAQRTRKFNRLFEVLEPFTSKSWSFKTKNDEFFRNELMTDTDKRLFGFNLAELNWEEYFENYVRGMREFVLKESEETLQEGRNRMRKIYLRGQSIPVLTVLVVIFFIHALFF